MLEAILISPWIAKINSILKVLQSLILLDVGHFMEGFIKKGWGEKPSGLLKAEFLMANSVKLILAKFIVERQYTEGLGIWLHKQEFRTAKKTAKCIQSYIPLVGAA